MFPRLLELGPIDVWGQVFHPTIHTYGVLLAIGFLVALKLAASRARKVGIEANLVLDLGIYVLIAGLVGAKLLLLVVDWEHYRHAPWTLLRSGGVFYGGLLAAIATALWFFRKYRMPAWQMADVLAPAVALGHGIGRLGCFSAGCCYGRATGVPWAVRFTDTYAHELVGVPLNVPLHPTQLYEAAVEFATFGFLLFLSGRKRFHGQVFWTYVALYGAARFVIEFYRGDPRGTVFGGALSTSQFIALLMLVLAGVAFATLRRPSAKAA